MKKLISILLVLVLCVSLVSCGKQEIKPEHQEEAKPVIPVAPENTLHATYKDNDLNDLVLYQNDDGSFGFILGLFRLTQVEGEAEPDGDGLILSGIDSAGNPIKFSFYVDSDSYTLEVIDSTWEYLENGQKYPGFLPELKGE